MNFRLRPTVRILMPALGISLALGAQAQGQDGTPATMAQAQAPAAQGTGADDRSSRSMRRDAIVEHRVSDLLGKRIDSRQQNDIGEIADLVIDANSGRVQYAVLSIGGFLGIGDELVVYPAGRLEVSKDGERVRLDADRADLERAPSFAANAWPDLNSAEFRNRLEQGNPTDLVRWVPASRLLDADVRNARGNDVGDVQELVLDWRNRKVNYAVIEFDQGWLSGDPRVALPMKAFRPVRYDDSLGRDLILTVAQQQLEKAPRLSGNDSPNDRQALRRDLNRYAQDLGWSPVYGAAALGTAAPASASAAGSDNARTAQSRGQDASAQSAARERVAGPQSNALDRDYRLSQVIGMDVRNPLGENLGEINDLVLDLNNGRVHYAILALGGFLGLGEKLVPYPVTQMRTGRDWNELVLDVDREKLDRAAGIDDAHRPDWDSADYRASIDRFFGKETEPAPKNARFVRASDVLDADLHTKAGDNVGNVQDLVVNLRNGQVRFAVVEFDPGWLQAGRQLALPMKAFAPRGDGTDLVLAVERERLRDAPVFDPVTWRGYDPGYYGYIDRYATGMGWGPVYPYDQGLGRYSYGYGGFAYPPGAEPATAAETGIGTTAGSPGERPSSASGRQQ